MKFPIIPETRVTFRNNLKPEENWKEWKLFKDCSDEEKEKFNLASPPKDYILLDRDLPERNEEEIKQDYEGTKKMLIKRGINNFMSWFSRKGWHILMKMKNLDRYTEMTQKEIKRLYVELFGCDIAKISSYGIVAVDSRPHFKNGVIYNIVDDINHEEPNEIHEWILERAHTIITSNEQKLKITNKDMEFEKYFEEDSFFQFIKTTIIPDNTQRDLVLFPNLAIACFKSGKSLDKIEEIMRPIIEQNFPGKNYREFLGWIHKSFNQEIQTYNQYQLNEWGKTFFDKEFYDLKSITIQDVEEIEEAKKESVNGEDKLKVYWDRDLKNLENAKTEWLISSWIPVGDICFIAGKAASFKSTIAIHCMYAIAEGKLVFNNYATKKSRVLYLNEENSKSILMSMINRVKNGLDITADSDDIAFSILENTKIDKIDGIEKIIDFINKYKIEVVVFDSFRRFISFDENSATEMNALFNNLKYLRSHCNNLTIIILHHLKKENAQYKQDWRDMLRGSSDIVNSADSVIGIRRKHGLNVIQIEHIKNRSGEELTNKIIKVDVGDKKDKAYFYESVSDADADKVKSKVDECAEDIVKLLRDQKLTVFTRSDLSSLESTYSVAVIQRALRLLKDEETVDSTGDKGGKYTKYIASFDKKEVVEKEAKNIEKDKDSNNQKTLI